MTDLSIFKFDSYEVRTSGTILEPLFVGLDICLVLDISNSSDALSRLDDDEKDEVVITDAIGRQQKMTVINESGLWSLVLTSRKPQAKRFKKWLTSEVIPAIRKTGAYSVHHEALPLALSPTESAIAELEDSKNALLKQIAELTIGDTKIAALVTTELICKINIHQLADSFDITRTELDRFLRYSLPHIPKEGRRFVEPSVAAVLLLQNASHRCDGKSHEIIVKLLTEFLTPQE